MRLPVRRRRAGPGWCRIIWSCRTAVPVLLLWLCVGPVLGACTDGPAEEQEPGWTASAWEEAGKLVGKLFQVRNGQEKYVWPALELRAPRLVAALLLAAVGACLAGAGGVGGAGLFVPLLHLLVQFDAKTATVLSSVMTVAGSLSNVLLSLGRPHPDPEQDGSWRPVIDFDAALLLQPILLLGSSLGVVANGMLPAWMIVALVDAALGYVTYRSLRVAMRRWAKESLLKQRPAGGNLLESVLVALQSGSKDSEGGDLHTPLLVSSGGDGEEEDCNRGLHWIPAEVARDRPIRKLWPVKKFGMLAFVWLVFFGIQALRGRNSGQCGPGYWLSTVCLLPVSLGLKSWIAGRSRQAPDSSSSDAVGDEVRKGGILVIGMAFLGGFLGSMLGVGGGMIVIPLFLEMGMPPQVTGATWCFMSFFSSSLSVVQYWRLGRIPGEHALVFAAVSFVASAVRQIVMERVVVRCGRASIIVFTVSAAMGLSALTMAGFGGYEVVQQYLRGEYMGFHQPRCIVGVTILARWSSYLRS